MKRKTTQLFLTILFRPFLILTLCLFTGSGLMAQRNCGSGINLNEMRVKDPARYQRFMELEAFTQKYIGEQGKGVVEAGRLIDPNTSVILIPVVVHVLWNTAAQNISDAQIQTQITVLNEDFNRLNADMANTPPAFLPVAANVQVEFRLACVDPNGNATTGITRTYTNKSVFIRELDNNGTGIDEVATGIKYTNQGGRDAWATNRYLNIWVANLGNGLLGYTQPPADYSAKPNTDGVVCRTNTFGRFGSAVPPYDRGRTATHEIGHWMNLRHIWGDANCGDDFVGDTPTQATYSSGCPIVIPISCNNGPNGNMFMNYMDYSNDVCMNLFTLGQRARMRAVFTVGGPRASFINQYFAVNQPAGVCRPTTVSVTNPSCRGPVVWTVSGPIAITAGQSTNQITIAFTGGTSTYATATATVAGYTDSKTFVVGPPTATPNVSMIRLGNSCLYAPRAILSADEYANGTAEFSTNGTTWVAGYKPGGNLSVIMSGVFLEGPGTYTVYCRLRNHCGTGPSVLRTLNIPSPPGGCTPVSRPALQPELNSELGLYPNPAGNWLQIALPGNARQATVRIIDVNGRVVKQATISQAPARLNIAALKAGLYFVQLSLPGGQTYKANFSKL